MVRESEHLPKQPTGRWHCSVKRRGDVLVQTGEGSVNEISASSRTSLLSFFYEKVIKVKADVAPLLMFDLRHISTEKFALGSLRSDDWQLGRPTASPLLSVFP